MKKAQITIKDLARKLGISTSTVSRALRGHSDVNPQTREAVRKLADELLYEPNEIALSLINKKTNTLGVMIPGFIMHFYAEALSGIQEASREEGYFVIICQSNESYQTEKALLKHLIHRRVDGVIV
ncbi:MAG: LacI family transcriptional regulator, partial [Cytophagales bacterium]|nr:LacI family transcriptional regulator [Cytophagales bacterium]